MPRTRRQSRLASLHNEMVPESPSVSKTVNEKLVVAAATPEVKRNNFSVLGSITQRLPKTPTNVSPIKPNEAEMHPQQHHQTASTPYDEDRWLGFFNMAPQTARANQASSFKVAETSPTPIKQVSAMVTSPTLNSTVTPRDFKFTFRREPSVELSEDAQRIMNESREEAARIRAQLAALPAVPSTDPEGGISSTAKRKIAQPKSRFSDVHKKTFNRMDSIANHASAWRADSNRLNPASTHLKHSPSKIGLDKPNAGLKRSLSKAELDSSTFNRSPSSLILKKSPSITFLSKPGSGKIHTPRSIEDRPTPSAKRVKHIKDDDAGRARPLHVGSSSESASRRRTFGSTRSRSGLLRPGFSSVMSPTKAFMARTQNYNNSNIGNSQIPALVRSKSASNLHPLQPPALPRSNSTRDLSVDPTVHKPGVALHMGTFSSNLIKPVISGRDSSVKSSELTSSPALASSPKRIKSILRSPNRRYTRDPVKIAAGTHLATPPKQTGGYPTVPRTEPMIKHVEFTASTKDKTEQEASNSTCAESGAVLYPDISYPTADVHQTALLALPSHDAPTIPGVFTFRPEKQITFSSPQTSTIRAVCYSNAEASEQPHAFSFAGITSSSSSSKRKLNAITEGEDSEKENSAGEKLEDVQRPVKKARLRSASNSIPTTPAKSFTGKSKSLRFVSTKCVGGLTAARLSLLARPKKRD